MSRAAEDGLALLEAAQQIHAERHGPKTFLPGMRLRVSCPVPSC
jgi:hypothetical protein